MNAKKLYWKELGRFISKALDLLMFVRATLEPKGISLEIIDWLNGDGRDVFHEHLKLIGEEFIASFTIKIDRTKPFDFSIFPGNGSSVWKGPKDGKGLDGEEDQDQRSLAITRIDPANLLLLNGLKHNEKCINGEDRRAIMMLETIQLDVKIGQTLYEEKGQKTLRWLHQVYGVCLFELLGTVIRDEFGDRDVRYFKRNEDGSWSWYLDSLYSRREADHFVLCLPITSAAV